MTEGSGRRSPRRWNMQQIRPLLRHPIGRLLVVRRSHRGLRRRAPGVVAFTAVVVACVRLSEAPEPLDPRPIWDAVLTDVAAAESRVARRLVHPPRRGIPWLHPEISAPGGRSHAGRGSHERAWLDSLTAAGTIVGVCSSDCPDSANVYRIQLAAPEAVTPTEVTVFARHSLHVNDPASLSCGLRDFEVMIYTLRRALSAWIVSNVVPSMAGHGRLQGEEMCQMCGAGHRWCRRSA